jgi:hypothetical protein
LSTTSISRSTSASVISAVRDQHNAASSVSLIVVGIARKSDGYAAAARARHASSSFSKQSANRSAGNPIARTRSSFSISARIVLNPAFPGSPFNSTNNPAAATSPVATGGTSRSNASIAAAGQPLDRSGRELTFEQRATGAQDPVDPGGARRFDSLLAKPGQQIVPQPSLIELHRAQLAGQPVRHPPLIDKSRLPEPELATDPSTVSLHRTPRPIAHKLRSVDLHLTREVLQRRGRNLRRVGREAPLKLEETSTSPRTRAASAPVLFASSRQSASSSVQHEISRSGSHTCSIGYSSSSSAFIAACLSAADGKL